MSTNPIPSTSANSYTYPTPHQNVDFSHIREPTRTIDSSPESNFTELSDVTTHRDEPPHLRHEYAKGRSPDMMPGPGEKAAPTRFRGDFDMVKQFIRKYNRLCAAYNLVDPLEKCERLIDYCSRSVRLFIESLPSYQNGHWAQLEKDVLKYYDADLDETRYIPDQLAELAEEWQQIKINDLATWKSYQREFHTKAGWLLSKDKVTKEMEAGYFWQGIHRKFRQDIEIRLFASNPTLTPKKAYPIDLVSSIAERLLERNRFEYSLMGVNNERPDWYTQTESDDSDDESTDSERYRKAKKHRAYRKSHSRAFKKDESDSEVENKKKSKSSKSRRHNHSSKSRKDTNNQDEVEQLISQMSHMDIADPGYAVVYYKATKLDPMVGNIMSAPAPSHTISRRPAQTNRVSFVDQSQNYNSPARPPTPVNARPPTLTGGNAEPLKCYVCGELGHAIRSCPKATELFRTGTIIRDGNGKIALPAERRTTSIRRQSNDSPIVPPTVNKENTITSRTRQPTINHSKPQTTFRPANLPVLKPIDVRAPRVRPSPVDDVTMKDQTQNSTTSFNSKPTIPDQQRQKPVPRQSELSNQASVPGIIKDLLEIPVSLRLKELLGISKDLSHAFTEQLRLRNPKQLIGSNLGAPSMENLPNKELNGSKPNSVPNRNQDRSPPAIDFIRSPIEADTKKQIIVASSGAKELKGLIRGVSLRNGDIETFADFYIGEGVPFQVLLGRPWQVENKVSIEQRDTGAYLVFPTQGRSGKKLELPTATRPAHFDSTLLAATPFPYQEDPYDSVCDSETDSEPEDDPENSGNFGDAYTFNVQNYDEVSRKINPHSGSGNQDGDETSYDNNHRLQYPLQTYFGNLQVDLKHYYPHGMTALSHKFLMEQIEFIHKVNYWCKPALNILIAMLCALPSIPQLVPESTEGSHSIIYFPSPYTDKYYLIAESDRHAQPAGCFIYRIITRCTWPRGLPCDRRLDRRTCFYCPQSARRYHYRLASDINETWRFVHPLELPSYHVSFRDLEYYVQLADEAARAYTNRPLEDRVLSIISSNNTIELSASGMDSLDFQQGVMLNTSIVSQRLRHPERIPVQQGHLFYTFVSARHLTSIHNAPHAHDPLANRLDLGLHILVHPILLETIQLMTDLNGEINPEYEFMNRMNDSQVDDDDEGSLADTTAAIYSQSQPSSRRNSISSDMSIENDYDPREPRPHDAKPPTAIEERFLNSIFSNPIPSSFNSTFASSQIEEPAAAQVDDESTASLPALETDDDELLSDTSTTRLNRFRLLRKRAYRFLGKKFNKESIFEPKDTSTTSQAITIQIIKIDRTDKDYDPELCLHPPHGLTTCLRHNLTHAEHYALQESGLSLDDVDNMNMHELREYLQALDTPPPPVSQPPPLPRLTEQELSEYAEALYLASRSPSLDSVTLRSQSSQMSLSDSLVPPATIEPVNPDSVQVMSVITDTSNSFQLGEPWNSNNLEALRKFVSGLRSTTTPSIRNDIILQPPSEALLRGTQIADGTFRTATPYPTPELELPSKPIDSSWTNITFPPL
ncbi:hypothetical protein IMY05_C4577000200 [Salix suchowensis]|nr:hypothetical protein IMY05_C4577000200 [Salix suchowensis]